MSLRYQTVRTRRHNEISVVAFGPEGGGEKAPVFLVHPINLRKECWLDLALGLANYRLCVAVDLAGHGESSDDEDPSLDAWVSDCVDVATSLELDRFHVVGGSVGGTIALCLASELPTTILSVTAMGSAIRDEPGPAGEPVPDLAGMLDTRTVEELFAVLAFEAVAPGSPPSLVTAVRHLTNTHGKQVVRRTLHAASAADATAWVPGVRCPVLVVTGEFDTAGSPDAGARMASSVGGRHQVLPHVGHLPMLEDAAAVLELLVPHLRSAESKADVL